MKLPVSLKYISTQEASELTGWTVSYIKKICQQNKVTAHKLHSIYSHKPCWIIETKSLFQYIKTQRKYPPRDEKGLFLKGIHYSPETEFKKKKLQI